MSDFAMEPLERIGRKNIILSMEMYSCLAQIRDPSPLTVNQLNQILDMHGFMKLHKTHRNVMIDAVDTLELMDPTRSTVGDDSHVTSSCAFIPMEDVLMDMAALNWQERSVTSLQTLNLNANSFSLNFHENCNCIGNGKLKEDATTSFRKMSKSGRSRKSKLEDGKSVDAAIGICDFPKGKRSRKKKLVDASIAIAKVPKGKRSRKGILKFASVNGYNSFPATGCFGKNDLKSTSGSGGAAAGGGVVRKWVAVRKKMVLSDDESGGTA